MSAEPYTMRAPCKRCGGTHGNVIPKGQQDTVRCLACDTVCYNAPRVETGRAVRTVTTVHNGIKPSLRAKILQRDGGRCTLCGATQSLHVSHVLSVKAGLEMGLTEVELNHAANLVALCEECNLGIGANPIEARVYAVILKRRSVANDGAEE